jgi:cell wall assembly regulator SMI1
MTGVPRPLTPDALVELEHALVAAGAPVVAHFRRAATDADLAQVVAVIGRELPEEVRVWWRWHDGAAADTRYAQERAIGPSLEHLSCLRAIDNHRRSMRIARTMAANPADQRSDDPSYWWDRAWLPLLQSSSGALVAGDCSDPSAPNMPIHVIDYRNHMGGEWATPTLPSLGALVNWWMEALTQRVWGYDPTRGWDVRTAEVWPARELTGLV